jgi:hypothetical protein
VADTGFARIAKVTDNYGHVWLQGHPLDPLPVTVGTPFTFVAVAEDSLNRPMEYVFSVGTIPSQIVVCGWGASTCSWTVPATPLGLVALYVAIRIKNEAPRLPALACYASEPCEDFSLVSLMISAP